MAMMDSGDKVEGARGSSYVDVITPRLSREQMRRPKGTQKALSEPLQAARPWVFLFQFEPQLQIPARTAQDTATGGGKMDRPYGVCTVRLFATADDFLPRARPIGLMKYGGRHRVGAHTSLRSDTGVTDDGDRSHRRPAQRKPNKGERQR
ncbi:hypothetical protein BOTBODRAFT_45235 [Botryobasidium botryosum FD-172 SS1]|uniref:Uncharacterized protein n=1 Tax=Botryobasidium botryosum (strain FD-172 SS1) TaxID=930990 RepID=A0A067MPQ1_BOTB1|nr:hypothetical protein BOTBODRAFT_45235 [Botryobasidium botryosum FD-172 SS1]